MEGQTEGQMQAQKEGWMDRPYFIRPFWPRSGVQKPLKGVNEKAFEGVFRK